MKNFEIYGLTSEEARNINGGAAKKYMTEAALNTQSAIMDFAFVDSADARDGSEDIQSVDAFQTANRGKTKSTSIRFSKFSR